MIQGNLLVGQSGGCTAVINQTLAGIIDAGKSAKNVKKVLGMRNGIVGLLKNELIDLSKLSKKQIQQLRNTPSSALGSCRYKLSDSDCAKILKQLQKYNVRFFLLIGGNDTAITTVRISEYAKAQGHEMYCIAVPKTIDNDLPFMDHTPGYGSAATFIANTVQEAGKDTEAMKDVDPIKIIEVLGRNSGWLVASSALGKTCAKDAPHLMCFPEIPFDEKKFLADVARIHKKLGYVVIVISETIKDKNNRRVGERKTGITKDSFGHQYLNCAAAILAETIEKKLKLRSRYEKPGSILRMSMKYTSPRDQQESYAVGKKAVQLANAGRTDVIVTLERPSRSPYKFRMGSVKANKIAGVEKYLPKSFINKNGNFTTKAFCNYAKPLVGDIQKFIRL